MTAIKATEEIVIGEVQSAGVLVLAEVNSQLCVAMSHQPNKGWVFPKGRIEASESQLEAAKREVAEEIGLVDFVVLTKLGIIDRPSTHNGKPVTKDIHMFLGWCSNPGPLVPPDSLHDAAAWKPVESVPDLIIYSKDRDAFKEWFAPALAAMR